MKDFAPNEGDIIHAIKKQMTEFIKTRENLTKDQKESLLKELNDSDYMHPMFSGADILYMVISRERSDWNKRNLQYVDLWKQIAINNALVNNEPHKVADRALEAFKKEFTLPEDKD